jgi:hypothetical protein
VNAHRRISFSSYFLPFAFFPFEEDVLAGLATCFFVEGLAAALFRFEDTAFVFPLIDALAFPSFFFPLVP